MHIYIYIYAHNDIMVRVVASGPGDQSSIPSRLIQKIQKMILVFSLFNPQPYKVGIKSKEKQSKERISALPYTSA